MESYGKNEDDSIFNVTLYLVEGIVGNLRDIWIDLT